MSDQIFFDGQRYISAADASAAAHLSRDYIARLCRENKVRGKRIGKNWYVDEQSLTDFVTEQERVKAERRELLSEERAREYGRTHEAGVGAAVPHPPPQVPEVQRPIPASASEHVLVLSPITKTLAAHALEVQSKLKSKALEHGESAMRFAPSVLASPSGVHEAVVRTLGHTGAHVPVYTLTPFAEFIQKFIALLVAFTMTFGTYALVDPTYARFAMDSLRDTGSSIARSYRDVTGGGITSLAARSQEKMLYAAENPNAALAQVSSASLAFIPGSLRSIARSVNSSVDHFVYAIAFPDEITGPYAVAVQGGANVSVEVAPFTRSSKLVAQTIGASSGVSGAVAANSSGSVADPITIIERRIETERVVAAAGGITEEYLDQKLAALESKLSSRLIGSSAGGGGGYTTINNNYQLIAQSNNIDKLGSVTIESSTITGGTISGTAISDVEITGSSFAGSVAATTLSASATSSLATTTVTGDLTVSGDTTIEGTLTIPGAISISSSTIDLLTNTYATTSVLSAVTASTTNLTWIDATGTNATTTNFFSTNASTTNATSTNIFAIVARFTSGFLGNITSYGEIAAPWFNATSTTATSTFAGGILGTRVPTVPHTFASWTIGAADANPFNASLLINPASAAGDANLIAAAVGGSTKFLVDAEGDVFLNNLTSVGSVTLSTTTASTFTVEGDATFGDSITDVTTVNGSLIVTGTTTASTIQGNFGVGTTTPWARISIAGAAGAATPLFSISSTTAGNATSTVFHIDSNGRVGVGTTSPSAVFAVNAPIYVGGQGAAATSTYEGNLHVYGILKVGTSSSYVSNSNISSVGDLTVSNATTTNIYSTTASSTNLYSTNAQFGALSLLGTFTSNGLGIFTNGFISQASSTVAGNFTATGDTSIGNFNMDSTATCGNTFHAFIGPIGTVGGDECAALNVTQQDINGNIIYRFGEANGSWAGEFYANSSSVNLNTKTAVPITFQTQGTERVRVASDGKVGIGTTSPSSLFSVGGVGYFAGNVGVGATPGSTSEITVADTNSDSESQLNFTGTTARLKVNTGNFVSASVSATTLGVNGTEYMRLQSGNVGIGTTSPEDKLHVAGNVVIDNNYALVANNTAWANINLIGLNSSNNIVIGANSSGLGNVDIYSGTNGITRVMTAGTERLRVTSGGYLGVGVTDPVSRFTVAATSTFNSSMSENVLTLTTNAGSSQTSTGGRFGIKIQDSANPVKATGIYAVSEADWANQVGLGIYAYGSGSYAERLRISGTGNVGIGTTSPFAKFSLAGDAYFGGNVTATGTLAVAGAATFSNYSNGLLYVDGSGVVTAVSTSTWKFASSTLLSDSNTFSGSNTFSSPLTLSGTSGTTTIASGQGFTVGSSQFVVQQGSGNIGIGTASPQVGLDLASASNGNIRTSSGGMLQFGDSSNGLYGNTSVLQLKSQGNTSLVVSGTNIGIGTTTPSDKLEIGDSGNTSVRAVVTNSNTGPVASAQVVTRNGYSSSLTDATRLVTTGTGYTASGALQQNAGALIAGSLLSGGLSIAASGSSAPIRFYAGGQNDSSERMRVTSSGSLGIGTTSPFAKFSLAGDAYLGGNVTATGTLAVAGAATLSSTLDVSGNTTLTNATSTNIFSTTASSTNLFASTAQFGTLSVLGALTQTGLGTFTNGFVSQASSTVVGTFTNTGAATFGSTLGVSGLSTFAGLISTASSTIGDGSQAAGLTIFGGATTTGNAYFAGRVGINTTSPESSLHVVASSFATLPVFERTGNSNIQFSALRVLGTKLSDMSDGFGATITFDIQDDAGVENTIGSIGALRSDGSDTTGALSFTTCVSSSCSEKMRLSSAGNVGIGTTTPAALLGVAGASYFGGNATVQGNIILASTTAPTISTTKTNPGGPQLTISVPDQGANTLDGVSIGSNSQLLVSSRGITFGSLATVVKSSASGSNLISMSSSGHTFHGDTDSNGGGITLSGAGTNTILQAGLNNAFQFGFHTSSGSNTQGLRLAGLTGGGTQTYGTTIARLQLRSDAVDGATSNAFELDTANSFTTAGAKLLNVMNAGTSKFVIDKDGNTGIGTTTPGSLLSVQGVANLGTATSTFYSTGGINLTGGCFAVNGTCIGGGGAIDGSGAANRVAYFSDSDTLTSSAAFTFDGTKLLTTYASSTALSVFGTAYFGGTSTTTISSNGTINVPSVASGYQIGGANALYASSSNNGVVVGPNSGASIFTTVGATHNSIIGSGSMNGGSVTGDRNNVLGASAMTAITSGSKNQAIGVGAFTSLTEGWDNIAIGDDAGYYNATGNANVYIGQSSGRGTSGQSQSNNVAVGYRSLYTVSTGGTNTTLGYQAGYTLTSGSYNVILGNNGTSGGITSGSNNILIGQDVQAGLSATGSNQLNIGNLIFGSGIGSGSTLSTGSVGIGTTTPSSKFHIVQGSGHTAASGITIQKNDTAQTWSNWMDSSNNLNWAFGSANSLPSTGLLTISSAGKVGIGTTTPFTKLEVNDEIISGTYKSTGGNFRLIGGNYGAILRNDGSSLYLLLTSSGDQYGTWNTLRPFTVNVSTGAVTLDSSGAGGASAGGTFTATGDIYSNGTYFYGDSQAIVQFSDEWLRLNPSGHFSSGIYAGTGVLRTDGTLQVGASGATFYAASGGNVGIGTTSPYRKLSVTDTVAAAQASIAYDGTRDTQLQTDSSGDFVINPSGDDVRINDDNLWVCAGGSCPAGTPTGNGNLVVESKIGIGNSAPNDALDVAGDIDATGAYKLDGVGVINGSGTDPYGNFRVLQNISTASQDGMFINYNSTGSTAADLRFYANGTTERMRISASNGYVGIGTTSPAQQLGVGGLLFVGANGATGMGTATSTFAGDIKILGKLDVSTIDPPYTIDGVKYATFVPSMTGVKEETTQVIHLDQKDESGKYAYVIDFDKQEKGSDIWLFYQITDFGEGWKTLVVALTPAFDGTVFYKKVPEKNQLIVYADAPGEVSMRLTGNRYDFSKWPNLRADQDGDTAGTHVISSKPRTAPEGANIADTQFTPLKTGL